MENLLFLSILRDFLSPQYNYILLHPTFITLYFIISQEYQIFIVSINIDYSNRVLIGNLIYNIDRLSLYGE